MHNGLLLAVQLDALFDRGYLAFDAGGKGLISACLSDVVLSQLGLSESGLTIRRLSPEHLPYLTYHRAHVIHSG